MKLFSQYKKSINENGCATADVNQGNSTLNTGVTNHLTPIGNIVNNVRNLFAVHLGVVASIAEDGVSLKLNSSHFTNENEIRKILHNYEIMRGTCLASYIMSQGLNMMKAVNVGQFFVVYFCPSDINTAQPCAEPAPASLPHNESLDNEMFSLITESDDEEEIADITKQKLSEIITSKDKVKAAKQLELLVAQEMELPREYYFAGVKAKDGDESIALRWKYTKKRPHNKTSESVRSLLNIFDNSKEGVWVSDFAKDSMFKLPEEVETLIKNIIEFLGAKETDDPCVYSLEDSDKDDTKEEDKKDEEDNKSDDKSDDKENNKSDDNSSNKEDDNKDSDGDGKDDLL